MCTVCKKKKKSIKCVRVRHTLLPVNINQLLFLHLIVSADCLPRDTVVYLHASFTLIFAPLKSTAFRLLRVKIWGGKKHHTTWKQSPIIVSRPSFTAVMTIHCTQSLLEYKNKNKNTWPTLPNTRALKSKSGACRAWIVAHLGASLWLRQNHNVGNWVGICEWVFLLIRCAHTLSYMHTF